ncbi:hypothetical protein EJD97_006116 [Solanum chilense]|uniref:Uncharacterized protein n=1 Tax=Solanum chilense TaxID=4083 RepID=A0A6N2AL21_SOLCI|nr:hypothetical protein EJD97_006116 [Solanum chilense]
MHQLRETQKPQRKGVERQHLRSFDQHYLRDDSVAKNNVGPQSNSGNFDQQTISLMQIDFANVDDVNEPVVDVGKQKVSVKNVPKYRMDKVNAGYVSDTEDPTRSKKWLHNTSRRCTD